MKIDFWDLGKGGKHKFCVSVRARQESELEEERIT